MNHYDHKDPNQHFFLTCAHGWVADPSPFNGMQRLKRFIGAKHLKNLTVVLIHVPLSMDAHYEIDNYVPQIEGCTKVWQGKL